MVLDSWITTCKRMNLYPYNMDEPWKHYAKWKKTQKTTFIYEMSEIGKFIGSENSLLIVRAWERRNEDMSMGFIFWGDNALKLDSDESCTTLWIYSEALNCKLLKRWIFWHVNCISIKLLFFKRRRASLLAQGCTTILEYSLIQGPYSTLN